MKTHARALLSVALFVAGTMGAQAAPGDMLLRVGAHTVSPKSNNHPIVNVGEGTSLTLSGTYFLGDNLAIEVLGAVPFTHDIRLNADGSKAAETKQLPPTVTLQYHFAPGANTFRPYLGAGLNYTLFFEEKTTGALTGGKLALQDSLGLAAEAGVDIPLSADWAVNLNVRRFDIDANARLNGEKQGTVEIDPWAYGIMLTRKWQR